MINKKNDGMPITPFLTATGFLAAILVVWAQLWVSSYKSADLPHTLGLGLGLIWTYSAVIVALVAFALAGWSLWRTTTCRESFRVTGSPLGLLVSALIMTGIDVGQSLISAFTKFWNALPPDEPLPKLESLLATPVWRYIAIGVVVLGMAFIITMSLLGIKKKKPCYLIAEVVLVGIVLVLYFTIVFFELPLPSI